MGKKKTKLMLFSTLVEVEVGVELGKMGRRYPAYSKELKIDNLGYNSQNISLP